MIHAIGFCVLVQAGTCNGYQTVPLEQSAPTAAKRTLKSRFRAVVQPPGGAPHPLIGYSGVFSNSHSFTQLGAVFTQIQMHRE